MRTNMTLFLFLIINILLFEKCVISSLLNDSCVISNYDDVAKAAKICNNLTLKNIIIPAKKTMEIDLQDGAKLIFDGHITHEPVEWPGVLIFVTGNNVEVSGTPNHLLDGMGPQHWKGSDEPNISRPRLIRFKVNKDSVVKNLNLKNCATTCVIIQSSDTVVSNIHIDNKDGYPGNAGAKFAKNTDGFDVSSSINLTVKDSIIYNQDDCVAVNAGYNILFDNLWCNGSHGFSLSVRSGDAHDIEFRNCRMEYANNAIHVKTHNDGQEGKIYNIVYRNITFKDIDRYAITIQQNYPRGEPKGNIPITNLTLDTIKGTMTGNKSMGISIICAENACSNWKWSNIDIEGAENINQCENAPSEISC